MPVSVSTPSQQVTASVSDDKVTATVSAGFGPTGPQGGSGVVTVTAPITNSGTTTAANIGLSVGTGLQVAGGSLAVTYGTSGTSACAGNDARLSDAREWSASTVTQADAEAGTSTSRFAFTPLRVFQAIAAWWAGSAAKTKLDGIAAGATANATDAQLRDRSTHTGTQTASTISDFTTAVIAAAPPTVDASLLTQGTLPDARLSSNIARTSDVSTAVANLVGSSPATLDTLKELSDALGSDANFATTVANSLAGKAATVHTHAASDIVSGTLGIQRLPFVPTYPIRAVHVSGVIRLSKAGSPDVFAPPTYATGGTYGDLATLATMEFPATTVTVTALASVNKALTDNPGYSLSYSSLEVALIDADNRLCGWGTTTSSGVASPTNGTGGYTMTLPVNEFPTIGSPSAWILTDTSGTFSGNASFILNQKPAYSQINSRLLDYMSRDWANIANKPSTFAPSAHKSSHATGGSDALSPSDIGAAAASHAHSAGDINFAATDRLLGRSSSGAGAGQEIVCTSAGRALLDDADAAAQRTTLGLGTAATSNTGDFATAGHTHAQLHDRSHAITSTSDHTATAWRVFYSDASGVQELSLGASGTVLTSGGTSAAPSFAALPAGGTKTIERFTPRDNQPPSTAFATLDTRNSVAVLDFDAATDESAVFVGMIPEGAALTSGLIVRIVWMATSATSGDCRWGVQFEKIGTDLDSDSFDTSTEAHSAANGTSGIETVTEITATAIDSLAAGDRFRLKVFRNADDATNDTMTGDAELVAVEVRVA